MADKWPCIFQQAKRSQIRIRLSNSITLRANRRGFDSSHLCSLDICSPVMSISSLVIYNQGWKKKGGGREESRMRNGTRAKLKRDEFVGGTGTYRSASRAGEEPVS